MKFVFAVRGRHMGVKYVCDCKVSEIYFCMKCIMIGLSYGEYYMHQ